MFVKQIVNIFALTIIYYTSTIFLGGNVTSNIKQIAKAAVATYVITGVLLLVLSFLLYKLRLSDSVVNVGIWIIYGLSNIAGGIIIGKLMKNKRLIWGMLIGALYFLLLLTVSLCTGGIGGVNWVKIAECMLICIMCGGAGGILS